METRRARVIVSAAGGTAGKNAKTYKVSLPSAWLSAMGIDECEREVSLCFDGQQITVAKRLSFDDFLKRKQQAGHSLRLISYYDGDVLCSSICADFTDRSLAVKNEDVPHLHRAFGVNEVPTWDDFTAFLESRCIPRHRDGLRYYLQELGLDAYDPFAIVLRTNGRMAEDRQWLKAEVLS